jgi:ABC-type glycerol-3-phosphate transport system permease component
MSRVAASQAALARPRARSVRLSRLLGQVATYLLLAIGAILVSLPFYWLVRSSLLNEGDNFVWPPILFPNPIVWRNYVDIFQVPFIPLPLFFRNSVVLVFLAALGEIISTSLAGYAFGRLRWWGRNFLFAVLVATMFLPSQVTIIPLFLLFKQLGWLNSLLPLIVPSWLGHALYIFLMRQFVMTIPPELDDAARIDGCGTFRIYWNIVVPLSAPALATIAIFSFQTKWNQFFEPLIYINKVDILPLAVGVRMFSSAALMPGGGVSGNISWSHLLAATVVMVLPIVIVFFVAQRAFIQGIVVSGVKG